jgi:threonine 3-dehydrogenase
VRARVKAKAEPGLWMQDVPLPEPGDGEVLIRVHKTSICGTDLHIRSWDAWAQATVPVPMVVGHEFTGEITAVGTGVQGLGVGQRVAGEGHVTCGHCRNCKGGRREFCHNHTGVGVTRPGAFADYVVIPAQNVFVVPDHISTDVAAVLDPLGNATHTALRFDVVGEDVLITGAGPIGVMAAAIVRHVGARHVVVTDVNPYRLAMATEHGATRAVDVRHEDLAGVMVELGMSEGFDIGLEMSGSPQAMEDMLANLNHGARVAMLGLPKDSYPIDWGRVITHMITIKGIYGREMYDTWYAMSSMLQTSEELRAAVRSVITHRFPAEKWQDAFLAARSGACGKVVLNWS